MLVTAIVRADFANIRTIDDDGYSAAHLGAAAAGTTLMALDGINTTNGVGVADYARNVVITVTHASSVVAMSGVITGYDQYGTLITEDWLVTATGVSKTFTGAKAFKRITSITEVVVADASANTIIAGDGKVLGLPFKAVIASIVKELAIGSIVTNGVLVAASTSATADLRGTYTPNGTPNDTNDWSIWYLVEDPTVV